MAMETDRTITYTAKNSEPDIKYINLKNNFSDEAVRNIEKETKSVNEEDKINHSPQYR